VIEFDLDRFLRCFEVSAGNLFFLGMVIGWSPVDAEECFRTLSSGRCRSVAQSDVVSTRPQLSLGFAVVVAAAAGRCSAD
jgi:hypothetical protein